MRAVSQGVKVLREEDHHVLDTAAVYLASLVDHRATVRVRVKVKARYVARPTAAPCFSCVIRNFKFSEL